MLQSQHQSVGHCWFFGNGVDSLGLLQIWGSLQHKSVQALATLDEKLEQTPLLEKLTPQAMPDEVTDSSGELTQDCNEVGEAAKQRSDDMVTLGLLKP